MATLDPKLVPVSAAQPFSFFLLFTSLSSFGCERCNTQAVTLPSAPLSSPDPLSLRGHGAVEVSAGRQATRAPPPHHGAHHLLPALYGIPGLLCEQQS